MIDSSAQTPLERALREELGKLTAVMRDVGASHRIVYTMMLVLLLLAVVVLGVCAYGLLNRPVETHPIYVQACCASRAATLQITRWHFRYAFGTGCFDRFDVGKESKQCRDRASFKITPDDWIEEGTDASTLSSYLAREPRVILAIVSAGYDVRPIRAAFGSHVMDNPVLAQRRAGHLRDQLGAGFFCRPALSCSPPPLVTVLRAAAKGEEKGFSGDRIPELTLLAESVDGTRGKQ